MIDEPNSEGRDDADDDAASIENPTEGPSDPAQGSGEAAQEPAPTDEEIILKGKQVDLENKETELAKLKDELETEKENRSTRRYVANVALGVMLAQIIAANGTFIWYGDSNGWEISPAAISAWMGATVIQVVSVVLVIINYLFPNPQKKSSGP